MLHMLGHTDWFKTTWNGNTQMNKTKVNEILVVWQRRYHYYLRGNESSEEKKGFFFKVLHELQSLFFFFFLAAPRPMEFPGQGSDPSRSHDLRHRCGNTGSLTTHCNCDGSNLRHSSPKTQSSQDKANPSVPHWELLECLFLFWFF